MSAYFVGHLLQGRRFLVTGATGGAGSKVVQEIERCGGDVVKFVRIGTEPIMGNYDGIVHCAGCEAFAPLTRAAVAPWGAFQIASDIFVANVVNDGGSIVLMSSVAAVRGASGMSAYCAAKAAIEGLTRAAAVELAPRKIRVNAIRAGAFRSPMHERISKHLTDEQHQEYFRKHPLGFGSTEDIANAVLFLLSDASKWITGTALAVDGGFSAK